jgi:hypothetical protein
MGARRLFAAAIVGLGLLVFTGSAQACTCASLPAKAALRSADAVIVARLLEVVPRDAYRSDFRYRVQRVYKSAAGLRPGAAVLVRSSSDGSACGLPDAVGRRYGLLLSAEDEAVAGEPYGAGWRGASCGEFSPGRLRSMVREASGRGGQRIGALASCAS